MGAYFIKPKENHVTAIRNEGRFNLLSSDSMVQYFFKLPHLDKEEITELKLEQYYYLSLDDDYNWDGLTPLEVAYELHLIYSRFFFHPSKDKIAHLMNYLESIEDNQSELRANYELEYAKAKVKYWSEIVKLKEMN